MPKAKGNKQRLSLVPRREESHPPPERLPIYRLLTGKDDESFCQKVSDFPMVCKPLHTLSEQEPACYILFLHLR